MLSQSLRPKAPKDLLGKSNQWVRNFLSSLTPGSGGLAAFLGPSGCGKTSAANILSHMVCPAELHVFSVRQLAPQEVTSDLLWELSKELSFMASEHSTVYIFNEIQAIPTNKLHKLLELQERVESTSVWIVFTTMCPDKIDSSVKKALLDRTFCFEMDAPTKEDLTQALEVAGATKAQAIEVANICEEPLSYREALNQYERGMRMGYFATTEEVAA